MAGGFSKWEQKGYPLQPMEMKMFFYVVDAKTKRRWGTGNEAGQRIESLEAAIEAAKTIASGEFMPEGVNPPTLEDLILQGNEYYGSGPLPKWRPSEEYNHVGKKLAWYNWDENKKIPV